MISDDQLRQNIAANLQRLLETRGLTRSALARLTGDSLMTISVTVAGKHVPGTGVVARIAEALDVSVDRLVNAPPEQLSKVS